MKIRHSFINFSPQSFQRYLLILISMIFMVACDQPDHSASISDSQNSTHIKLRFGHDMPEGSSQHKGAVYFAKLVKEKSGGKMSVDIFPDQVLGNDHQMIAMAQSGQLDIILPPTAKLSFLVPEMQLFDLPFLFPDVNNAHRVLDSRVGKIVQELLTKHNLVGASFWESGFKQLTTDRPLETSADLAGMTFRIMRSEIISDQFSAWNTKPLPVDFGMTRSALESGVANGQENPLGSIYNMKFHEVQSNLYLTHHGYLAQALVFSMKKFNVLPKEFQTILMEAAEEAAIYQRMESRAAEEILLDKIKESGIKVSSLPVPIEQFLKNRSKRVIERHRSTVGSGLIELVWQTIDEDKVFSEDQLVIALDADMAGASLLSGLAIRRGIEIAIDEINQSGGVLGKQLVLTARDNSMVSARGIDNIKRFSKIPNLVAVFGGISSPVALSELDLIHEKKILYLDPWAAATPIVENNRDPNFVFRVSVRDEYAAGFLLLKALEVSDKVGLLLVNNGWGRSNHRAFIHELEQRNLEAASIQWFDWGTSDHDNKIDALYQEGAEVIIYVGNSIEAVAFMKELATKDAPVPVISHWGVTGGNFEKLAGDALHKVDFRVLQTFSFINNHSERAKKVVDLYLEKYSVNSARDIVAPTGTAHAYDLTHLLAMAIKKAGSTNSDLVREALENLPAYHGLVRRYDPPFTRSHHDALDRSDFFLSKYDNGVLVPIQ